MFLLALCGVYVHARQELSSMLCICSTARNEHLMSKAYLNNNLLETILIIGINTHMYVGLYFIALGEDGI